MGKHYILEKSNSKHPGLILIQEGDSVNEGIIPSRDFFAAVNNSYRQFAYENNDVMQFVLDSFESDAEREYFTNTDIELIEQIKNSDYLLRNHGALITTIDHEYFQSKYDDIMSANLSKEELRHAQILFGDEYCSAVATAARNNKASLEEIGNPSPYQIFDRMPDFGLFK